MSTPSLVSGSRMLRNADWLFDSDLEALDNASEAAYARREQIERSVDFMDVLEEMCEFTKPQQEEFMKALARANAQDLHLIHCLVDQAKENIIKRRLAQGE